LYRFVNHGFVIRTWWFSKSKNVIPFVIEVVDLEEKEYHIINQQNQKEKEVILIITKIIISTKVKIKNEEHINKNNDNIKDEDNEGNLKKNNE